MKKLFFRLQAFRGLFACTLLSSLILHGLLLYGLWQMLLLPHPPEKTVVPVRMVLPIPLSHLSPSISEPQVISARPLSKPVEVPRTSSVPKRSPRRASASPSQGALAATEGPVNPPKKGLPPVPASIPNAIPVPTGNSSQEGSGNNADVSQPPSGPHAVPGGTGTGGQGTEGTGTGKTPYLTDGDEIRREPTHDLDACTATIKVDWERSSEVTERKAGTVVMRVLIDERGRVQDIRVVRTFSKEIAAKALGHIRFDPACKFGPALDLQGRPVRYLISEYIIHFEL